MRNPISMLTNPPTNLQTHHSSLNDALSLAQALVRCPSVTPHPAGTFEIIEIFLRSLGFHAERIVFGDVTNFYASWGSGRPHFCFAGHVDVVPPGDMTSWSVPPFLALVREGALWGRGVADMKGAIACFMRAVQTFLSAKENRQNGQRQDGDQGTLSFLLTSDEEGPAVNGTQRMIPWLRERGIVPDICLIGEPTGTGPVGSIFKVGRRGSLTGVLQVFGTQGHIAYPHLADNPIPKLLRCLQKLVALPMDIGTDLFEASRLEVTSVDVGNPTTNIIPRRAEARFGVRFNPLQQGAALAAQVRAVCEEELGAHELALTLHGEAFLTTDQAWISKFSNAIEGVTGAQPCMNTTGGTTDGRFLSALCPVLECGLPETTIHQVDEHVSIEDLRRLEAIYLAILRAVYL